MKFDFNDWEVPFIQEPNTLMNRLNELDLIGRKIVSIRCVGRCYNLGEDEIEDRAYVFYKEQEVKNPEEKSDYNNISDETLFLRYVQIDEPIVFYLDNGSRVEIDFSEASSVKIGKNSLPDNIEYGCNTPNADANVIFSSCLNNTILGFEVVMANKLSEDFTGSHGIVMPTNQDSYISSFRICLEGYRFIEFNNFFDYGEVCIKDIIEISKLPWKELKKGIMDSK